LGYFKELVLSIANANASLSAVFLHLAGEDVHVNSATLESNGSPVITVLPACTAVEPIWFFCAAILAFPAFYKQKIVGILAGIFLLSLFNLVRIISLYLVGVHFPQYLDTVHEDVWFVPSNSFIIALMIAWIVWSKQYGCPSEA